MSAPSRRQFIRTGAALMAAAAGASTRPLDASPLGLPVGLELYTVRNQLRHDFPGTLSQVAAIGYKQVELFSFLHYKPADVKRMVRAAGLEAPSAHCQAEDLKGDLDALVGTFHDAGVEYMVCSFPAHRPGTAQPMVRVAGQPNEPNFTIDDYKWMATTFNRVGEKCQKAGLQFAYHNHNLDFKTFGGETALYLLMHATDPKLVKLEMDCYWVTRAGKDPVEYMKRYSGRVPLLHIKDMKPGLKPTTSIMEGGDDDFTEVGRGVIDWKRIFRAAHGVGVKAYFVEQDKCDRPPLDSAKISYEYLSRLAI